MFAKLFSMKSAFAALISACHISVFAASNQAPVQVQDAWIRATVAGQQGTGGFMTLIAHEDLRLIRIATPIAGAAHIHEMHMNKDNVMEMHAVEGLSLSKNQPVELKPGGYHLMLEDLKQKLDKNTIVPLTLYFKNSQGKELQLPILVPVSLSPVHEH